MKSWKKQLSEEFDRAAPVLREDIVRAPVPETKSRNPALVRKKTAPWKLPFGIGSAGVAVLAAVFLILWAAGIFAPATRPENTRYIYTLEINPAVAFVTDEKGNVESVKALNTDADTILSDTEMQNRLRSVSLADAVCIFTDAATQAGYLNPAAESAVRFSGSTEEKDVFLANAAEHLRRYFREKGIYALVVEDRLTADALGERVGIPASGSLAALCGRLETLPDLFGERALDNADGETLRDLYETYIVGGQTLDFVRDELLAHLEDIVQNAQMLREMTLCSYRIMIHKDNPYFPLPADYWTVKKRGDAEYSEEFSALMQEMAEKLTAYEQTYGVAIHSNEELREAADAYSSLSDLNLKDVFSSLTPEDFRASTGKYISILKNIGFDTGALETVLTVPATAQDYAVQFRTIQERLFLAREEKYREIYEQPRQVISAGEYEEFLRRITEEYGSPENFWNKK